MKKKLVILGMVTALLFTGCSSKTENINAKKETNAKIENPDFRNCKWGMSKEEVKKFETDINIFLEEEDIISATTKINGMEFGISYYFNNDKLVQCA